MEETTAVHHPGQDSIDRMLEKIGVTLNEVGVVVVDSEEGEEIMQPAMHESRITAHQRHGGA